MSKISLEPNASGAGTFSIVSPDSNINRTLNLPDESGTIFSDGTGVPGSAVIGQLASSNMPSESVIQVVQESTRSQTVTNSTSFVDTDLSGQITPFFSTSKILVLVSPQFYAETDIRDFELDANITRNSTSIKQFRRVLQLRAGLSSGLQGMASMGLLSHLDSPSSSSLLTYTLQISVKDSATSGRINKDNSPTSIITLMEIAG